MFFFSSIFRFLLDSVFPLSEEEKTVLKVKPEEALKTLPRSKPSPIPEACAIFSYRDERVRKLIWGLKFRKSSKARDIAGQSLYSLLKRFAAAVRPVIVIPMPITKRRRRERGFNQCELLVDKITELDSSKDLLITKNLLVRKTHLSRQTHKNRANRIESAIDIFEVNTLVLGNLNLDLSKDYIIIVIDDVITTGSTISDAIKTLRKVGLEKTFGLSVAH